MISPIISARLQNIEQNARQTLRDIEFIRGLCEGMESVANEYPIIPPTLQLNNGNEFGNHPTTSILEVIKAMIVELNIKGSVRERPNGLIELRTQALGSIYGRTKEEIERKLTELIKEASKRKNTTTKKKYPLLSEFFNNEYLPYKETEIKDTSSYKMYMRRIVNDNFDKPINQYTIADIEKYLLSIPQTRTRQVLRGVFNNIFTYAKRIGAIKHNPCDDVEKVKHEQNVGTAFSFKEQEEFFNTLFNSSLTETKKLFYTFVYLTGTRRGEALDITTKNADFENNTLHIPGTKTKNSNRTIPMFPLVKEILQRIQPVNDRFFPIAKEECDEIMKSILQQTHKLHDLRHTFGTIKICVEKIDPKTVSLWMGHSTLNMTLTRYTHPEQLDSGLFYNGALTEEEKLQILREEYESILNKIYQFLS